MNQQWKHFVFLANLFNSCVCLKVVLGVSWEESSSATAKAFFFAKMSLTFTNNPAHCSESFLKLANKQYAEV